MKQEREVIIRESLRGKQEHTLKTPLAGHGHQLEQERAHLHVSQLSISNFSLKTKIFLVT